MMTRLYGISPKPAISGIPKKLNKLSTTKASAVITKRETANVPIHPKRFPFQKKYVKTKVRHP